MFKILKGAATVACALPIVLAATLLAVRVCSGVFFWLALGIAAIGLTWLVQWTVVTVARRAGKEWNLSRPAQNATLVIVSTTIVLAAIEGLLAFLERRPPPVPAVTPASPSPPLVPAQTSRTEAEMVRALEEFGVQGPLAEMVKTAFWRHSLLTMPPEWELGPVETHNEIRSCRWHGVLHVVDRNGLRRTTPFPAKREDHFRIVVVGDSLTYGFGVEESQTYTAMAQRLLEQKYRVEFLNLGRSGDQSEDTLRSIRRFAPELRPDLVLYGVCLNDFLPSGVGILTARERYAFPLRKSLKEALIRQSRVVKVTSKAYDQALMRLGLRPDIYDQVLADFSGYRDRFARDVKAMNEEVVAKGLPPVVGIVLNQFPLPGSRQQQIVEIAENALRSAGMTVIGTDRYERHFAGANLSVSKWEGHPNEIAHAVWAAMIAAHLEGRGELTSFRKK